MKRTAYVYVCDSNARVFGWARHSVSSLRSNVSGANVFILTAGRSSLRDDQIIDGARVMRVDGLFAATYGDNAIDLRFSYWPALVFARLLPQLVPELSEFDRFVYMDADTEVLSPAFSLVEHIDIRPATVAGVMERYAGVRHRAVASIRRVSGIALPEYRYINSGFLVIDRAVSTDEWRASCRSTFEYARSPGLYIPEQDGVNAVLRPGIVPTLFAYSSPEDPKFAPRGTLMQHFAGGNKAYLDGVVAKEQSSATVSPDVCSSGCVSGTVSGGLVQEKPRD